MTGVLRRRGNWGNTHSHTRRGRTPCEDEGRDWGHASTSQETQRLPANHQKLGERHGTDSLYQPAEKSHLSTPWSWLLASRTVRFELFKPSSLWTLWWQPQQTNSVSIHNIFTKKLLCHCVLFLCAHTWSEVLPTREGKNLRFLPWVVSLAIVVGIEGSSEDWGPSDSHSQKAEVPNFVTAALNSLQLWETSNPKDKHDLVSSRFLPTQTQV